MNSNDLIGILNQKYQFEYLNEPALKKMLGYEVDEAINMDSLNFIHPDDIPITLKNAYTGFNYGSSKGEIRIKHKNGKYLWLELIGISFITPEGEKKAVIIGREITDRKRAEQIIKEDNLRLTELEKLRNEFIYITTHELKTPLTSMLGACELVMELYKNDLDNNVKASLIQQ